MEENTNRWNSFTSIRRKGKALEREREEGEGEVDSVAWTTLVGINVAATRLGE